jgi:hypothetical protein
MSVPSTFRWVPTQQGTPLQLTTWWTLWNGCITLIIMTINILWWLMIRWRPTTTAYQLHHISKKGTNYGCTIHPDQMKVAAEILGKPLYGGQHPVTSLGADVWGTLRQTSTIHRGCLGWTSLRKMQCCRSWVRCQAWVCTFFTDWFVQKSAHQMPKAEVTEQSLETSWSVTCPKQ